MPLEESVVFRQLETPSRFTRFDYNDAILVLLPFNIHYLGALILGRSLGPPWITLVAAAVAVYFLRTRFPDGIGTILQVLTTPRHLSALAPDRILRPYPARRSQP